MSERISPDYTKPVETVRGKRVELMPYKLRDGGRAGYVEDDIELLTWNDDGSYICADGKHQYDLRNVPEPVVVGYVCFYHDGMVRAYNVPANIPTFGVGCISRIKVTCVPGQYDE